MIERLRAAAQAVVDAPLYADTAPEMVAAIEELRAALSEPAPEEKPTWWPHDPYSRSMFTMNDEEYAVAVPDPFLRTRISGFLMGEGWRVTSDDIWNAMREEFDSDA